MILREQFALCIYSVMMASADVKSSQTDSQDSIKLPPGFESLQVINRMPNERLSKEPLVNVIGLVKDYLPPMKTRGKGIRIPM